MVDGVAISNPQKNDLLVDTFDLEGDSRENIIDNTWNKPKDYLEYYQSQSNSTV